MLYNKSCYNRKVKDNVNWDSVFLLETRALRWSWSGKGGEESGKVWWHRYRREGGAAGDKSGARNCCWGCLSMAESWLGQIGGSEVMKERWQWLGGNGD